VEIEYHGANCFKVQTKKAVVVVDDNLASLGGKSLNAQDQIVLISSPLIKSTTSGKLICDSPGEYEVSGVSIVGVPARAHTDEEGSKTATIFKLIIDDIHLVFLGHIYPELNEQQQEAIGRVDVAVIPVGGHGFTLDPTGALKVIRKLEPKLIIPSQYQIKGLNYEVPALELEAALHDLAMDAKETVPKLKLKSSDLPEQTSLVVIESQ
jgi:L-ascorbate metabolism protein UlaG (beta-lactamase superfamily)